MYSRQEAAQLTSTFWTTFGHYMSPLPSAEEEKINWINYKTGQKGIYFKMRVSTGGAEIAIVIQHKEEARRKELYAHFMQLKSFFETEAGKDWKWTASAMEADGSEVAKIYCTLPAVSIHNREDWPALVSFFKQNLLALDRFWCTVKYSFEALG